MWGGGVLMTIVYICSSFQRVTLKYSGNLYSVYAQTVKKILDHIKQKQYNMNDIKYLGKRIKNYEDFIGYYQIVGAVIGFLMLIISLMHTGNLTGFLLAFYLVAILLFGFSFYSGRLALKRDKHYRTYTTINQILQILSFSIAAVTYNYYSGLAIEIGVNFSQTFEFNFSANISGFGFEYKPNRSAFELGVNIVPFIVIGLLSKIELMEDKQNRLIELLNKEEEQE